MADDKKKGAGKPPKKEKRPMVVLDPALHKRIKRICVENDVQIQDFVHQALTIAVDREWAKLRSQE